MPKRVKKKDFKLSESLVGEFEQLAPSGKQTAIVEQLISEWVSREKAKRRDIEIRQAYGREKNSDSQK